MTTRKVLVDESLFVELGGDRVDWGEPDEDGFYEPTVLLDDERLGARLHAAVHPSHDPRPECAELVEKLVARYRAARGA